MSMSKKDFVALADELKSVGVSTYGKMTPKERVMFDAVVRFCGHANPAFKSERFRAYVAGECGPSGGELKASKPRGERWPGGGPVLPGDR